MSIDIRESALAPAIKDQRAEIDPITREVIRHKLDGIAEEMEITLIRSAFSTIVKEGLDASASIFSREGESLAQSVANPVHLGTLMPMVKIFLRSVDVQSLKNGDIYVTNDPDFASSHLPDFSLFAPVIVDGQLLAVAAVLTHHQDIGGMTPGSTPTNATEIYQEGLRVPLVKLASEGKVNEDLVTLLRSNSRVPHLFTGDLWAQIAACEICRRRMLELVERYRAQTLLDYFAALLEHSEAMVSAAIRQIPEGVYAHTEYMDNDGVDLDQRIRISASVEVRGDRLVIDFAGTNPQVRGPFNCVPTGAYAAACYALKTITDPSGDIPINGGCFRHFELKLPEHSIVNPDRGVAIGCRALTIKRLATTILGAMRHALPERVPADHGGVELLIHFGGKNARGERFVTSQILVGGSGAWMHGDGVDAIETDTTNCMNIPAEAIEMDAPIRVHRVAIRTGSGGDGQFRGGLGQRVVYEFLADGVTITFRGERHYTPAEGMAGGKPGAVSTAAIVRAGGGVEPIPSKGIFVANRGDRLEIETAGGGGYGEPRRRARVDIERDLADRKIEAPLASALEHAAVAKEAQ